MPERNFEIKLVHSGRVNKDGGIIYRVRIKMPNGQKVDCEFEGAYREACAYAKGIHQGLMVAMNAIGFVPEPDLMHYEY